MLRKSTTHVVLSGNLGVLLSEHRTLHSAVAAASSAQKILQPHDDAKVIPASEYKQEKKEPAVNMKRLQKWLQDCKGKKSNSGVSVWLEISVESKVSIRTLTNICSGTYDAPRQKTLRGLDAVRKRMIRK